MSSQQAPHIGIDARMFATSFTGIGRYTHELTNHLFQLRPDWKFTLFLAPEAFQEFESPHENIQKVIAPEKHYSFAEQTSFLKRISQQKFDLFHFPHFNAPLLYRRKSVVTIHDLTISFFPGKKKTSWFHKLGYKLVISNVVKKAQRVIAVSKNTKSDLQKILHTPEEKINVIWNGLGSEFLREKQNLENVESSWQKLTKLHNIQKPYFLYTGVHREHKNVVGMIQAFSQFLKNGGDAELIITGKEDPHYYPEIGEIIIEEKLEQKVKRVGLVSEEELKALFYHAHVFVFPSFYEGFGLPPLEAMSMEIPVIASNTSAMPEICGDAVEYFDPHSISQMAKKMQFLAENEERRQDLIFKGKERIKLFSWQKMAEETVKVYEESLG